MTLQKKTVLFKSKIRFSLLQREWYVAPSGTLRRNPGHLLLLSITGGEPETPLHPALSMFGSLTGATDAA